MAMSPMGFETKYHCAGESQQKFSSHSVSVRKLQHLQKRVLRTTGIPNRYTLVCESQVVLEIPYMYNYIIKLCEKQKTI
jgi:hypothetical protein